MRGGDSSSISSHDGGGDIADNGSRSASVWRKMWTMKGTRDGTKAAAPEEGWAEGPP